MRSVASRSRPELLDGETRVLEIILLSGGVESTTLLYMRHASVEVHALFLDYGQRAAAPERAAARAHCDSLNVPFTAFDLASLGHGFRRGQAKKLHVPTPHRNAVAIGIGLSFAALKEASVLNIALNRDDLDAYPSASLPFLTAMGEAAHALELELATPLRELSKADVIRTGVALGVDFAQTYSCLLGYDEHCGHCPQCLSRKRAFALAGEARDVVYRHG